MTRNAAARTRGPRLRGWKAALGAAALLACVAGAWAYWLWSSEPAHWRANEAYLESRPRAELEAAAEAFEQRITRQLTASSAGDPAAGGGSGWPASAREAPAPEQDAAEASAEPGATQQITMTLPEVNAWLATRLEPWMAHQSMALPGALSRPMVAFEDQQLVVAFRYSSPRVTQVVSLYLDLELLPDGRMSARLDSSTGGRLPVPLQAALGARAGTGGGAGAPVDRLRRVLEGEPFEPKLPLDGARSARIEGYRIDGDRLELTVRKLREPARPR